MSENKNTVLIVDDNPNNLKVVAGVLKEEGYDFRMAKSGAQALKVLEKIKPDLILLDIQMPEMDGFETCKRIKADESNEAIPVIYLTANTDTESINKAFKSGGVDFVTKPFNSEELLARIKTHIQLKVQSEQLVKQNVTKDRFISIISHDLKNPMATVLGFSELLKEDYESIEREKLKMYIDHIYNSTDFSLQILENLLEWSRIQGGVLEPVRENFNLSELLKKNIEGLEPQALAKSISIESNFDQNLIINADKKMILTVIRNLISNAIKFTHKEGIISIFAKVKDVDTKSYIEIAICDTGIGMSEEDVQRLFKISSNFISRGTNNEKGTGLGLILCNEFILQNNGEIKVESELGVGSKFIFQLEKGIE